MASRSADNLAAARAELEQAGHQIYIHAANLSDADAAQQLVDAVEDKVGPIAVLVNSAGAAKRYAPAALTPQSWRDAMDAKYFPYINTMDAVIKKMVERGNGAIINIIGAGGKIARTEERRVGKEGG